MADAISALRSCAYFQDLSNDHLEQLASILEERQYKDGDALTQEGQPRMEALFLTEGHVERSRTVEGHRYTFETLEPGASFGLLHCLEQKPSYATATAKGPVRALLLPSQKLNHLLDTNAGLSKAFTCVLARTVRSYTKLVRNAPSTKPQVVVYDSRSYWQEAFDRINDAERFGFTLRYVPQVLNADTAPWSEGAVAAVSFVHDVVDGAALQRLQAAGCRCLALRSAGVDKVDLGAARALGLLVVSVPEYSPYAVAEHAVALALALNRHLHQAHRRTQEHDFRLEGLLGFDMFGKTAGVLGTGRIGRVFIDICVGFGMKVVCFDKYPNQALKDSGKAQYMSLDEVLGQADIISLHLPLLPDTHHIIDAAAVAKMKPGALLINCGRGGLIETAALIDGLQSGRIRGAGLDVFEGEEEFFFSDLSCRVVSDPALQRLLQFHNVILTAHQAFFTAEGLEKIVQVTLNNIRGFLEGQNYDTHPNAVKSK